MTDALDGDLIAVGLSIRGERPSRADDPAAKLHVEFHLVQLPPQLLETQYRREVICLPARYPSGLVKGRAFGGPAFRATELDGGLSGNRNPVGALLKEAARDAVS